jgi:hypothetical protein
MNFTSANVKFSVKLDVQKATIKLSYKNFTWYILFGKCYSINFLLSNNFLLPIFTTIHNNNNNLVILRCNEKDCTNTTRHHI